MREDGEGEGGGRKGVCVCVREDGEEREGGERVCV